MNFAPIPPADFTPRSATVTVETLEEFQALYWAHCFLTSADLEGLTECDTTAARLLVELIDGLYQAIDP